MEIFHGEPSFEKRITQAGKYGYSFVARSLTRQFAHALAAEVVNGPFETFFDVSLGVYQKFDVFSPSYFAPETRRAYPLMRELGDTLGQLVRDGAGRYARLQTWQPNDVAIQRYDGEFDGIGRHRDFASDIDLIVSYTVMGTGAVCVYSSRAEIRPSRLLQTGPGSELILRAPGLYSSGEDIRVTHAVPAPICGPRISVTYRLATKLGLKGV